MIQDTSRSKSAGASCSAARSISSTVLMPPRYSPAHVRATLLRAYFEHAGQNRSSPVTGGELPEGFLRPAPLNQPRPAHQRLGVRGVRGEGTHRFHFGPPQASQSGVSPVPRQPPHSKTSRQFGRFRGNVEFPVLLGNSLVADAMLTATMNLAGRAPLPALSPRCGENSLNGFRAVRP